MKIEAKMLANAIQILEALGTGDGSPDEVLDRLSWEVAGRIKAQGLVEQPVLDDQTMDFTAELVSVRQEAALAEKILNLARFVWRTACLQNSPVTLDIRSNRKGLAGILSNLTDRPFTWYGHTFRSIESALQSMKYTSRIDRRAIANLAGLDAKQAQHPDWANRGRGLLNLPDGKQVEREGPQYLVELRALYSTALTQCPEYLMALAMTGNAELRHRIGRDDIYETILTEKEFTSILTSLRTEFFDTEEQDNV